MIAYVDSSVLVKKYIVEADSGRFGELWRSAIRLFASAVGYAEVICALARRLREGGMDAAQHAMLVANFKRDWLRVEALRVTGVLDEAIDRLALTYGLRGFDTIHLATALHVQEDFGRPILFASADRRLMTASRMEGLRAWPEDRGGP